jgi:hypothetical protein
MPGNGGMLPVLSRIARVRAMMAAWTLVRLEIIVGNVPVRGSPARALHRQAAAKSLSNIAQTKRERPVYPSAMQTAQAAKAERTERAERNVRTYARRKDGLIFAAIGREFDLTSEMVRRVAQRQEAESRLCSRLQLGAMPASAANENYTIPRPTCPMCHCLMWLRMMPAPVPEESKSIWLFECTLCDTPKLMVDSDN